MVLSSAKLRFLLFSLFTASFLGGIDHSVVATSLATIGGELGSLEQVSWVLVSYTLTSTVLLPIFGRLGDQFGVRRLFLASLALFVVASLLCGFAQDMPQLIIGRVLQGIGSAGIGILSQTVIAHVASPRQRPRLLSIVAASYPVAFVLGPFIGGMITDFWGWPWVFWVNVPIGVVALLAAAFALPEVAPVAPRRVDLVGALTFAVATVSLVLAVSWIRDVPIAALITAAVALIGFVVFCVVELRVPTPLVPVRSFANRTIAVSLILSAVIGLGLFAISAYLPTYFQMAYGVSATVSGFAPVAAVGGMLMSNMLVGWLASRSGRYRRYPLIGTTLGALALGGMWLLPPGMPFVVPMVLMFVVGTGTGCFQSLVVALAQAALPRSESGGITASVQLARQLGSTVGIAAIGMLIALQLGAHMPPGVDAQNLTPQYLREADPGLQQAISTLYHDVFGPLFLAVAGIYVIGVIAALLLPQGRLSDELDAAPIGAD